MPIYEYKCSECNYRFEELVFQSTNPVQCQSCGSRKVERILSAFAFRSGGHFVSSSQGAACNTCNPSPSKCKACK